MGWYFSTAEELSSMGFTVYASDRIASGKSSGGAYKTNSGISNKKGHIRTWTLFTKILGKMIDIVDNENPKKKLHLWANSYGAKIVTAYMLEKNDKRIDSIVFTTPGLFRDKNKMPLSFNVLKILFASKTKGFPTPIVAKNKDNGAHWFTSDRKWFARIEKDELSGREFTKTFFFQTKKLDKYIAKKAKKKSLLREIPQIYLMVRNDPMMDNSKVEKHIKILRNTEANYKFYEGGEDKCHFLTFTSDRKEVLRDVKNFILGEIDRIEGLM
jgi:alpha-beta hydrolase superfamily lysophospholipase